MGMKAEAGIGGSIEQKVPDRMNVLCEDLTSIVEIDIRELADNMYLSARRNLKESIDESGIKGSIDRFPSLPDSDTIQAELHKFLTEEFNKVRLDALTQKLGIKTNMSKSNGMFSGLRNLISKGKLKIKANKTHTPQ